MPFLYGRDDRIRTCGPLVPNQMRYQTALHPANIFAAGCNPALSIISNKYDFVNGGLYWPAAKNIRLKGGKYKIIIFIGG